MTNGALGLLVGLALGFALVFGGFGSMLVVALFGGLGYTLPKLLNGTLDLNPVLASLRRDR